MGLPALVLDTLYTIEVSQGNTGRYRLLSLCISVMNSLAADKLGFFFFLSQTASPTL